MKIDCRHGYFVFEEVEPGQFSRFKNLFGLDIQRNGDHFTFGDLVDAPDYSLPGGTFLGCPTTEAFEGRPWEVMEQNNLVYDFSKGLVLPIISIVSVINIFEAKNFFTASGMIIPGSITDDGKRVKDYAAYFSYQRLQFLYSAVNYV